MTDILRNMSFGTGLILWIALIIVFCLLIYVAFHYMVKAYIKDEHKNIGIFLFRFSAALLAFILSITFANQRVNYFKLQSSIEEEASKLVDVHLDLKLFNTEDSQLIQAKVRDYIVLIAEDGWVSLQYDPFMSKPITSNLFPNSTARGSPTYPRPISAIFLFTIIQL